MTGEDFKAAWVKLYDRIGRYTDAMRLCELADTRDQMEYGLTELEEESRSLLAAHRKAMSVAADIIDEMGA